ncbi:ADP-ribose 1''-phosphate phosphatase [Arthrobotrys musiformis]|uniref:ADP-ribose 1''-phosphate phosphatase n=1 Tax=Arthrobotrys musiformis TaxID=47236 RepID=A0AAV9WNQ7_9PEZI
MPEVVEREASGSEAPSLATSSTYTPDALGDAADTVDQETGLPGGLVMVHSDIFAAPANSVLIHACNCQGSWGAGIALTMKRFYPRAYVVYRNHCDSNAADSAALLGTALLIPPQPGDRNSHWITCLFTSQYYGRRVDAPDRILEHTASSFEHFLKLLGDTERGGDADLGTAGEVHTCKINSGRFGVPWERTGRVLEDALERDGEGRVVFAHEFEEETGAGGGFKARPGGGRGGGGLEKGQQILRF